MISTVNALNIIWAIVSLGAGAYLLRKPDHARTRLRSAVAVLLAAVCLFPVISASDDEIRLALLGDSLAHRPSSAGAPSPEDPEKQPSSPLLARLLDSLDSAQVQGYFFFSATLGGVGVFAVTEATCDTRRPTTHLGRAPPLA